MSSGTVQQRNPAGVETLATEYVRNTGELHLSHKDTATNITAAKESVILVTTGAPNVTVTLPVAADSIGKVYAIKKVDAGAGNVIVDGDGGETIDGALTQTLAAQWDVIMIVCDGVAWFII
jgi:hypothetical protein